MKQGHSLWAEYNDTIRGNRHTNGVIRADVDISNYEYSRERNAN